MDTHNSSKKGSLEVICGSMFSGKSEELIRRLKRAELARQNILVFKHQLDDRTTIEYLVSHNGTKLKAVPLETPEAMMQFVTEDITVVGIDEVQFFSLEIIDVVCIISIISVHNLKTW